MKKNFLGMGIAALILAVLTYIQGGWLRLGQGCLVGGKMFIQLIPLIILALITSGLISVMISEKTVSRWLGKESGWKGFFWGAMTGAIMPGGPYVYFPLSATFLLSGARIGAIISFVAAKNLWTISRLPLELALLGPEITFIRYVVTFIFPILVGVLADAVFSGFTVKIREEIKGLQKIKEVKT